MKNRGTVRQTRLRLAAASAGVGLLLMLAACGGKSDAPGVASAGRGAHPGGSARAAGVLAQYLEGQRKWVKCLRDEGFAVPDPDAQGKIDLNPLGGNGKLKADPKWRAAQEKCAPFALPVPEELEKQPPKSATEIAHARQYAECVRSNGQPDFPDPGPDGNWPQDDSATAAPSDQQAAAIFRASQICEPVLDGRPPTTPDPNAARNGAG